MQKFRSGLAESLLHRSTAPLERACLQHQPMILGAVIKRPTPAPPTAPAAMRRASDHSLVKRNTPDTTPIVTQEMRTPKMMGCALIAAFKVRPARSHRRKANSQNSPASRAWCPIAPLRSSGHRNTVAVRRQHPSTLHRPGYSSATQLECFQLSISRSIWNERLQELYIPVRHGENRDGWAPQSS